MDKASEIEKEFSAWAEDYGKIKYSFWEGDLSEQHKEDQNKAIEMLKPEKGDKILDVGCGVGLASIKLASIIYPGTAYGIDITKEMVSESQKNAKRLDVENVRFEKASVLELPFKNDKFDGSITTHAAHHFYKPVEMLSEIRRVLKQGSRFVLIDTCGSSKLIQEFEERLKKEEKAHHKFFKLSEAKKLLKDADFKEIEGYRKNHTMYLSALA